MSQSQNNPKPQEEPTEETRPICPLCQSPLIAEAIEAGKCQCCGHRFEPVTK
jgi:hypothetical protein